jgi:hypothetical protein
MVTLLEVVAVVSGMKDVMQVLQEVVAVAVVVAVVFCSPTTGNPKQTSLGTLHFTLTWLLSRMPSKPQQIR